ncbi:YbaB/EbfC family nucleoid-associated protein [Saccharopolyspora halophila]
MLMDASERIQEMMRRFEEQAQQAGQLKDKMQEVRGRASSDDGSVSVEVAPSGAVVDLRLSPEAMRQSHSALQQAILGAIRAATQNAAQQMDEVVDPALGERAEQFKEAFNAHSRPPQDEAPAGRSSGGDDEDFSHGSYLR